MGFPESQGGGGSSASCRASVPAVSGDVLDMFTVLFSLEVLQLCIIHCSFYSPQQIQCGATRQEVQTAGQKMD